ncbi:hypothetical protein [Pseudomonas sp. B329]|uniref:hypothetical protein n=1 Tax=Pseudomonas sp. B329 TaxID=1553459 RepID=UPI002004801D|nr:hypothetical protein [Pseudomonas sp. B329]MCK3863814.1 response regulator [Pseudomonas sp. B329]
MATPYLRILIVDDQLLQSVYIEKLFNSNGYYRVAPVASFNEFLLLASQAIDKFDLVVLNGAIKGCTPARLEEVQQNCSSIGYILIYGARIAGTANSGTVGERQAVIELSGVPGIESIKTVMQSVDPRKN